MLIDKQEVYRIVGGTLVFLVGIAVAVGATQLWNGVPTSWPDVVASDAAAVRTSRMIMFVASLLVVGGVAAIFNLHWGASVAGIATVIFLGGGIWANRVLFGDARPKHTVPNFLVGALILALLWIGSRHDVAPPSP